MKMKKSTWLLLVLALVAIFLVAGCEPTTPAPPNGEEPGNGEEPPTPPADTDCPKVVKTEVSKLYVAEEDKDDPEAPNFQIKITFDEDFDSSCIQNPAFWTITVANADRVGTPVVDPITSENIDVSGKVVTIKARVVETGTAPTTYELVELPDDWTPFTDLDDAIAAAQAVVDVVNGYSTSELLIFLNTYSTGGEYDALLAALEAEDLEALNNAYGPEQGLGLQAVEVPGEAPVFYGLICNKDDAERYEKEFGLAADTVKFADEVSWELSDCAVYDELGNVCCEYEGEDCCVEPYCEECPEPEEGCDLTEPGACL